MSVQTWTVTEVCQGVSDLFEQAFPDEIWISGEISGYRVSPQGHAYFDLVDPQHKARGAAPKLSITLFAGRRRGVEATLRKVGGLTLDDGIEVRVRGSLGYYAPQGKVQLLMTAIDPRHTLGQIAAERDRILRALKNEQLLDRNSQLALPAVPMKIGIVTSVHSAAYNDVVEELVNSGFAYDLLVSDARVQGKFAEASIVASLGQLQDLAPDVILLVRGGGSRTDLSVFDSELVARKIAISSIPVITGIGHEIDRAIADEVSHTSVKTPTAAAVFLNDLVSVFLTRLETGFNSILRSADRHLSAHDAALKHRGDKTRGLTTATLQISTAGITTRTNLLVRQANRIVSTAHKNHHLRQTRLVDVAPKITSRADERLGQTARLLEQLHPDRMMNRGYSITRDQNGALVRSLTQASPGSTIHTTLAFGEIISDVSLSQERQTDD